MRVSLLLLLACTAVLAAQARADASGGPEALVQKVQEYAQKASAMAKSALSRVQESEVAQQARQWLSDNAELVKQRLEQLKEQLVQLWKRTSAA
ncbi:apolipoprotein C-III [Strigops habroptila]|uniref:apolipoprotein C-III n=1 Tax=Strigops habroptila TaxID=2489341 RepID=UPI0011CF6041|nr:apolipoprotein C-III [Strigops habroptila]